MPLALGLAVCPSNGHYAMLAYHIVRTCIVNYCYRMLSIHGLFFYLCIVISANLFASFSISYMKWASETETCWAHHQPKLVLFCCSTSTLLAHFLLSFHSLPLTSHFNLNGCCATPQCDRELPVSDCRHDYTTRLKPHSCHLLHHMQCRFVSHLLT